MISQHFLSDFVAKGAFTHGAKQREAKVDNLRKWSLTSLAQKQTNHQSKILSRRS